MLIQTFLLGAAFLIFKRYFREAIQRVQEWATKKERAQRLQIEKSFKHHKITFFSSKHDPGLGRIDCNGSDLHPLFSLIMKEQQLRKKRLFHSFRGRWINPLILLLEDLKQFLVSLSGRPDREQIQLLQQRIAAYADLRATTDEIFSDDDCRTIVSLELHLRKLVAELTNRVNSTPLKDTIQRISRHGDIIIEKLLCFACLIFHSTKSPIPLQIQLKYESIGPAGGNKVTVLDLIKSTKNTILSKKLPSGSLTEQKVSLLLPEPPLNNDSTNRQVQVVGRSQGRQIFTPDDNGHLFRALVSSNLATPIRNAMMVVAAGEKVNQELLHYFGFSDWEKLRSFIGNPDESYFAFLEGLKLLKSFLNIFDSMATLSVEQLYQDRNMIDQTFDKAASACYELICHGSKLLKFCQSILNKILEDASIHSQNRLKGYLEWGPSLRLACRLWMDSKRAPPRDDHFDGGISVNLQLLATSLESIRLVLLDEILLQFKSLDQLKIILKKSVMQLEEWSDCQ